MSTNYKLSILIPTYNGEEFLGLTLDSIVNQIKFNNVEIVLCDDLSSDKTYEIAQEYSDKYKFISVYKNDENLGMDGNFEKVVSLAKGEFIWFTGQDDIFCQGAVDKVLSIINNNKVDFIYVNYSQHSHDLSEIICPQMLKLNKDILCKNYKEFLNITTLFNLPGFLPSFVLRTTYWEKSKVKKYYETNFIQLGAFFEALKDLNLYIVADPYIKGRIPNNRWQKDNLKLLDVLSGGLEVETYAYKKLKVIQDDLYNNRYKEVRKWIFNSIIATKSNKKNLNKKIKLRLFRILKIKDKLISFILYSIPNLCYNLKVIRKILKNLR